MRLPLILLLVVTFFAIAHSETPVSQPPPPPPASAPSSPPPPPPPTSTPSSPPPPPPTPASKPISPPPPPPPPATWTPVKNVNSTDIQQVGQFAVRVHALKYKVDLVFGSVVSGKTQPWDGGYNYQLVIAVSGRGAKSPRYEVAVWGILKTMTWKLWSFNATK